MATWTGYGKKEVQRLSYSLFAGSILPRATSEVAAKGVAVTIAAAQDHVVSLGKEYLDMRGPQNEERLIVGFDVPLAQGQPGRLTRRSDSPLPCVYHFP